MCTAISYLAHNHYFGRNLDLDHSYNESVTITPRNFPLEYRFASPMSTHYAIIGMAAIMDNYPLYYDATNEHGLSVAGLNFPGNAVYHPVEKDRDNITPFEFVPWILGQCKTVSETLALLSKLNMVNVAFKDELPLTPLHWIISDRNESITVEPMADGIVIHKNPIGVLTNNPPFEYHLHNLCNYMNLTTDTPTNRFNTNISLIPYSLGMGGIGLPGDLSSASRFVRASFIKGNSVSNGTEPDNISQFFHILGAVSQQRGCAKADKGYEITVYSSCCNTDTGVYYYNTYNNSQICAIDMKHENLNSNELISYPLITEQNILQLN